MGWDNAIAPLRAASTGVMSLRFATAGLRWTHDGVGQRDHAAASGVYGREWWGCVVLDRVARRGVNLSPLRPKLGGQADRLDQAGFVGDALPGDVERRAMID